MILPDTSIWIDHFRAGLPALARPLRRREIRLHPLVLGEIALGSLPRRPEVLGWLAQFDLPKLAFPADVMRLIETAPLFSRGIGWVDANLLACALIAPGATLWTRDKRLHAAATDLGVAYEPAAER